ncbi:hypothetical protein [Tellurirhabdus bombi]|uniref:hypothetical protein n=1 Tax=Tellurirhabdus bombi TaxID=2907205 RepID=UPI001F1CABCA|nr:hypothetical protein [Tellurirhabdus bombi]
MTINEAPVATQELIDNLLYVFADENVLLTQPRLIRRLDQLGERFYYYLENNVATFFISTTSFIKKVTPTGPHLIEWFKKMGDKADQIRDEAADYGTLMHICFADYHLTGYDFDKTTLIVKKYLVDLGYACTKSRLGDWTKKLNKAVASYAKFCEDFVIEPVLIEGMLASEELGIAGTLDLVAYATVKGRRILVSVDFKSGSIQKSAQMQLAINKIIFEENFPHLEIDENWSWSPKDFRDKPTYELANQTKTIYTPALIDHYLAIYQAEYGNELKGKTIHRFTGTVRPGQPIAERHQLLDVSDAVALNF